MTVLPIAIPQQAIDNFRARHHMRKLSLFGSVLTEKFRPDSDIDILVEFEAEHTPSLLGIAGMEIELSELLGGKVDLRTAEDLSRYFREEVVALAVVISEATAGG